MEHGRPLARACCGICTPIQSCQHQGSRPTRTATRRDALVCWLEGSRVVGLRCDRSLVAHVARDRRRIPELQKHEAARHQRHARGPCGRTAADHDGWLPVLRSGDQTDVRSRLCARPSDQETTQGPDRHGGTQARDRLDLEAGGCTDRVRGLDQAEHLVHRATGPHDPAWLFVPGPQDNGACEGDAGARRPARTVPLLLQLYSTALVSALRNRSAHASHAGGAGKQEVLVPGHLRVLHARSTPEW